MQEKDIKRLVVKQLKKQFPGWRRLPKKDKKKLAKQVLEEVMVHYRSDQTAGIALNELTQTPIPLPGIIPLIEMEQFIEEK